MNKAKLIELGLENIQSILIKNEYVEHLLIGDIKKSISKYDSWDECLFEENTASTFAIQINSKANTVESHDENFYDSKSAPFDRLLKWQDICYITIHYEDASKNKYLISWTGDNPNFNESQTSKINEKGSICIYCGKDSNVDDFYLIDDF